MERTYLNTCPYTVEECDRQLAALAAVREAILHRKLWLGAVHRASGLAKTQHRGVDSCGHGSYADIGR